MAEIKLFQICHEGDLTIDVVRTMRRLGAEPCFDQSWHVWLTEERHAAALVRWLRPHVAIDSRLLVASMTPHRYWRAIIDGKRAPILSVNVGFQGVIVPLGARSIRFEYFNPLFPLCGAISIISLLISIIIMIYHDH